MKLTQKLIDYLYRSFSKDPEKFLALRVRSSDTLVWSVVDEVLTVTTGLGSSTVDLTLHSIKTLVDMLASIPGLTIEYMTLDSHLSASVLLDGGANQDDSNGDHLYGYGSLLWAYMEPVAVELVDAEHQIVNMIDQMAITSADAEWLDEWGSYFGIPRSVAESDVAYGNRIIIEVMRPRANNKAIELAIKDAFGQVASVTDLRLWGASTPKYNGAYLNNGGQLHNATASPIYGLFQIVVGYDILNGGSQAEFAASVRALVEKFRDAGTHLDSLSLVGSGIADAQEDSPVDSGASVTITTSVYNSGAYAHDGTATYAGTAITVESLS